MFKVDKVKAFIIISAVAVFGLAMFDFSQEAKGSHSHGHSQSDQIDGHSN